MTKFLVSTVLLGAALSATIGVGSSAQAAGFGGAGGFFNSFLGQSGDANMSLDDTLVRISEKMNRKMPQEVDPDTRLDKVSAEPGHQIAYHYTMLNISSKDLKTASFYKAFRPTLQKKVCAAEDLKMFFRNRVTVAYAYEGKDGRPIGKLAFSPKDCGYSS
jgi:hypothetical protein